MPKGISIAPDITTGSRFGMLEVIEPGGVDRWNNRRYKCICDCGKMKTVLGQCLKSGNTRSCGCLQGIVIRKRTLQPWGQPQATHVFNAYRSAAKHNGIVFELTKEQVAGLVTQNCTYCGIEPSNTKVSKRGPEHGQYKYNGLDRIDPTGAYRVDNVVPCCKQCNFARRRTPVNEFLQWIGRVYNHSVVKEHHED